MIKSMTGFGRAKQEVNNAIVSVEIKSLNSKFFEAQTRMPLNLRDRDMELRQLLNKEIERGKVDVSINVEQSEEAIQNVFNKEMLLSYIKAIKAIEQEAGIGESDYLRIIMSNPNIAVTANNATDEDTWKQIEKVVFKALEEFHIFRLKEGKELEDDFIARVNEILNHLNEVPQFEAERIDTIRQRIKQGLEQIAEEQQIDSNRLEQEMIYYIEKMDISEEKMRLRNHCNFFLETLKAKEAGGKKLGFIIQEIGREINTLGAKANHAAIQRHVVEMKDELEKMKEQVANVL